MEHSSVATLRQVSTVSPEQMETLPRIGPNFACELREETIKKEQCFSSYLFQVPLTAVFPVFIISCCKFR